MIMFKYQNLRVDYVSKNVFVCLFFPATQVAKCLRSLFKGTPCTPEPLIWYIVPKFVGRTALVISPVSTEAWTELVVAKRISIFFPPNANDSVEEIISGIFCKTNPYLKIRKYIDSVEWLRLLLSSSLEKYYTHSESNLTTAPPS